MPSITREVMETPHPGPYSAAMTTTLAEPPVGRLLREWRQRRRRSQLDLALDVGVSTRHLSFVETGRSRPSAELIVALTDQLDVPLNDRNAFLLAAGYAPRYRRTALDDAAMSRIRVSLQRLLDSHDPYPGIAIDRSWNVVIANRAAQRFTAGLPLELAGPPMNVFRACLHPDGLARQTLNFPDWAAYLVGKLRRIETEAADDDVTALANEVEAYPTIQSLAQRAAHAEPQLLVPWELQLGTDRLSLFTTLTTFGTPRDITLEELSVELFYPSDDATEVWLRRPA